VDFHRLRHAVVVVGSPAGDMTQGDLIRNAPDPDKAEVVFAWDVGERNGQLTKAFPDRTIYFFRRDPESGVFYLGQHASRLGE